MRILIHNSDSPLNRGDRAILVGVIALVRERWPDADIVSLSQFAERDAQWYGIRFLPQSPYSVRPIDWMRLVCEARSCDLVLWGGGEILKDYTNRLGLVYWWLKLSVLRVANRNIVGAFQGIGPTASWSGRRLIAATVARTRAFAVRDDESREKLRAWGVRVPIVSSYDPAVLGRAEEPPPGALDAAGVPASELDGAIGFGVRRWFHYRRGGWVPMRFRRRAAPSADLGRYRSSLAQTADLLIERTGRPVVFLPMHLHSSEGDEAFSREVIAEMRHADRAHVLAGDTLSSTQLAGVMARLSVMVASRLHSAILASTAGVPVFVLYYVDKGRLFSQQLGLLRLSRPIEWMLEPGAGERLADELVDLLAEGTAVRSEIATALGEMAERLTRDFGEAVDSRTTTA